MKAHSVVRVIILSPRTLIDFALDLMWSDPEEIENWAVSPRGAGWLFGGNVTQEVRYLLFIAGIWDANILRSGISVYPVQPRQPALAHRTCTPARAGRLQVHVRRPAGHCLERAELLLPVREHGVDSHDYGEWGAGVYGVWCCGGE